MVLSAFGQLFFSHASVVIILIFMIIPLLIGSLAAQNSVSTINDFFVCNRKMGTVVSFFTVYATWWSSFAFLGSISYFYAVGSVYWTAIGWNVLFGLLYFWFGTRISLYGRKKAYLTPICFFADIYQSKLLNLLITGILIAFMIPHLQIQLYGGAIIIEIATKGMIPWQVCALMFYVIMIIYLWAGGLRAVAWADIFYGVLIFLGLLAGGFILVAQVDGVARLFDRLIAVKPELILLPANSTSSGVSLWLSMFLMIPLGEVMSPHMWLRMYATKEEKTFHLMPFLLGLATIAYVGSMLAGSAAVLLKPEGLNSSADAILPLLLVEYAPGWLMAIVMCCGAAACLSTANAEIHAASSLLTLDLYRPYLRPKASEKHLVFIAKLCIVLFSAATYLALILNQSPNSIVNVGLISFSGMAQIIVPALGGLLWSKSNITGAIAGLLSGIGFLLYFSFASTAEFPLHPGCIALLLNGLVFVACGLLFPQRPLTGARISRYQQGDFLQTPDQV